jgi:ubiquitin carboxyl-terminal hydrolase 22/27/51
VFQRYEQTKLNAQKLDTKLNFPLQLDMTPYTSRSYAKRKKGLPREVDPSEPVGTAPLAARSPGWYDLSTVVVHIGKIDSGHYVCFCRRGEHWFRFDDNKVTLAPESQVLDQEAYLLFYVVRSLGEGSEKDKEAEKECEKEEKENGNVDAEGEDDE